MEQQLIKYQNANISQDGRTILTDVDLELKAGEFAYLIGKVGTGKTTLLKSFYAEADVVAGEAQVLGFDLRSLKNKNVSLLRRKLGIIFQDFQLLTDRTVYDNLRFVLSATGWRNEEEINNRIGMVLDIVGMNDKADKMPNELSGGEQQRVVIARSVLNSPEIVLADEPTGNLDVETGKSIAKLMHNLCDLGMLVVMSTHNMNLIEQFPGNVYRCSEGHLIKE